MNAQMRFPVYLREDQWSLVDDLLRAAARIIIDEVEARKELLVQLRPESRVALRWCDSRIAEIRAEVNKRRDAVREKTL